MGEDDIIIGKNDITAADIPDVNRLIRQLKPSADPIDMGSVGTVMRFGTVLTVRDADGVLVGMGMIVPIRKFCASLCGRIEDVVVDETYRGRGLGKVIIRGLLEEGRSLKMRYVELQTEPERESANRLYPAMGFFKKDVNSYRYLFD